MRNSSVLPAFTSAPDVHVAHRDHAVERRLHYLVALQPFETREARLRGAHIAPLDGDRVLQRLQRGDLRFVLGTVAIVVLPGNHALRGEARDTAAP